LLVPRGTSKWPAHPRPSNYMHHFYKQAARCLGWCQWRQFHPEIPLFIKESVWPDLTSTASETSSKRHAAEDKDREGKMDKISLF